MDMKLVLVRVPGVVTVGPARVVHPRRLDENAVIARAGLERESVGLADVVILEFLVVRDIVVQREEGFLLGLVELIDLLGNGLVEAVDILSPLVPIGTKDGRLGDDPSSGWKIPGGDEPETLSLEAFGMVSGTAFVGRCRCHLAVVAVSVQQR